MNSILSGWLLSASSAAETTRISPARRVEIEGHDTPPNRARGDSLEIFFSQVGRPGFRSCEPGRGRQCDPAAAARATLPAHRAQLRESAASQAKAGTVASVLPVCEVSGTVPVYAGESVSAHHGSVPAVS